jgi:hypothetical protein
MEPMSFWQLVKNTPEWMGVFATSLFAVITIIILIRQVIVMRWQGRNSDRHERLQNTLLRLQLEHEFVLLLNAEREKILKLMYELSLFSGAFEMQESIITTIDWTKLQDTAYELDQRLRILDSRTYTDAYGSWYSQLRQYVDDVLNVVIEDNKLRNEQGNPSHYRKGLLQAANYKNNPINIRLGIETAIRMAVSEFKDKWDAALKSSA